MKRTLAFLLAVTGCSDEAAPGPSAAPRDDFESGIELRVDVPETGRVFVDLAGARTVEPADPDAPFDWDLAFEGFDVFTNGGASGKGQAAAFGPVSVTSFIGDTAPEVPFLVEDRAGGAFLDWYAYDATNHTLWSRYHVYGVRDGDDVWKVQILGYYGKRDAAVISALYSVRYAQVSPVSGDTVELDEVDATAGGTSAPASAPSDCLDLRSGERLLLAPDEARASRDWQLCFRRDSISVNGESGGPLGAGALDVDAESTATETLTTVKTLTESSTRSRFDAVDAASFEGRRFRGDRVVSAFGDDWTSDSQSEAWLVRGADGAKKYLVVFSSLEATTGASPGSVLIYFKPVEG